MLIFANTSLSCRKRYWVRVRTLSPQTAVPLKTDANSSFMDRCFQLSSQEHLSMCVLAGLLWFWRFIAGLSVSRGSPAATASARAGLFTLLSVCLLLVLAHTQQACLVAILNKFKCNWNDTESCVRLVKHGEPLKACYAANSGQKVKVAVLFYSPSWSWTHIILLSLHLHKHIKYLSAPCTVLCQTEWALKPLNLNAT